MLIGRSGPADVSSWPTSVVGLSVGPLDMAGAGGWSGGSRAGWPAGEEQRGPGVLPGPVPRQVQRQAPSRGRRPRRYRDQRASDGGGGGPGQSTSGEGGGGAGEVERHHGADQPGAVGGELPG